MNYVKQKFSFGYKTGSALSYRPMTGELQCKPCGFLFIKLGLVLESLPFKILGTFVLSSEPACISDSFEQNHGDQACHQQRATCKKMTRPLWFPRKNLLFFGSIWEQTFQALNLVEMLKKAPD